MKKLLILPLIALLFAACGSEEADTTPEGDSELMRLTEENRRLRAEQEERDSLDAAYHQAMMDIEANLAAIYQKEGEISQATVDGAELSGDAKDRIAAEINAINELMAKNRKKISSLRRKLKNSNSNIEVLETRLTEMEALLSDRDVEIGTLRDELANLNIEMELLYYENEDLAIQLDQQFEELNTAFYAMGSQKELMENNVITKEGGFIGMGKTEKMRDDFNADYFTRINIEDVTSIPLGTKKVKIITSHPESSYTLVGEDPVEKIDITKPQEFWKASKYLVIVLD